MSMRDVEDFAEYAVRFVSGCGISDVEKISIICNIYRFQDRWDTAYTRLRVYDTLVSLGFIHFFEPSAHPDYLQYKDFFDRLSGSGLHLIGTDPLRPCGEDNPLSCCWLGSVHSPEDNSEIKVNRLYCEAGSPLWARFRPDRTPPEESSPISTFLKLSVLAARRKDHRMAAWVYYIAIYVLEGADGEDERKLRRMKHFLFNDQTMLAFHQAGLACYFGSGPLEGSSREYVEWMNVYYDWRDRNPALVAPPEEEDTFAPSRELIRKYQKAMDEADFEKVFYYYGDIIKSALAFVVADTAPWEELFDRVTPQVHKKIMQYPEAQALSSYLRDFIRSYREWSSRKGDIRFYIEKGNHFINATAYDRALYYIRRGLTLDGSNYMLRLYYAYITIIKPIPGEIKRQIGVLDGLLARRKDHGALIRYLKAMGYYHLEDPRAVTEMAWAVRLDPNFAQYYMELFPDAPLPVTVKKPESGEAAQTEEISPEEKSRAGIPAGKPAPEGLPGKKRPQSCPPGQPGGVIKAP